MKMKEDRLGKDGQMEDKKMKDRKGEDKQRRYGQRKGKQRLFVMKRVAVFLVLCLLVCGVVGAGNSSIHTVMAAQKKQEAFGLSNTSLSLYVGNTYQLEAVIAEPITDEYGWTYSAYFYSSDENVVRVDYQSGLLRATGVGEADITAYYYDQTATCHVKVKANHCELDKEKLTLYEGQETTVTLTNSKNKGVGYEYFVYQKEGNYLTSWGLAVESKGKGVFSVKGVAAGVYYLDLSLTNKKGVSYSARCEVEVLECGFASNNIAVAEGGTVQLNVVNGEILSCGIEEETSVIWEENKGEDWFWDLEENGELWNLAENFADGENRDNGQNPANGGSQEDGENLVDGENRDNEKNSAVGGNQGDGKNPANGENRTDQKAKVDNSGKLTGLSEGQTRLNVKWRTAYGEQREDWLNVYVTKPEYVPFEGKLFAGDWYYPKFNGTSYYSKVTVSSSNEKVAEASNNLWGSAAVVPQKEGKVTLTFTVDGIQFTQKVQIINPKWEQDCAVVVKGKSRELIFSNVPKDCKVTWKTSDKKIATVSADGKVTGKKAGSVLITATLEGKEFHCTVTVGSGKGLAAVVKGEKVLGAAYSQEKRMQKGYYDCSSFAWRSYHEAGLDLAGVSYAPTAADLAKNMEKEKKVISYEYIDANELKPGDLIFYAGGNNGRYKNIDHVAMYYGAYYSWGDMNSGVIIHAVGAGVQLESYSWYRTGGIVMIARPVQ